MTSYANAVKTMKPEYPLIPEKLTLHELLLTIRNAGQLLRKLDTNEKATFGCEIRSLINNIVNECTVLHPEDEQCFTMKIIVPPLWYWARADNNVTLSKPFFHDIYNQEGLLLRSFLNKTDPLVIENSLSHNSLLQLFDNYYRSRRSHPDKNILYYNIPEQIQEWRSQKNRWRNYDTTSFAQNWLQEHQHELVQIPELPPIWENKDYIFRPVMFEMAIDTQDNSKIIAYSYKSNSDECDTDANISKSNNWADECDTAEYESSVTLRWKDNIRNTLTNVIIARNQNTGKLEISEQKYNPLLLCTYEIIIPK